MRQLDLHILVVDDHALMREAVRAILEGADDMSVVGEASSSSEALELAVALRPDLVLLDLRLPDADGLSCLDQLRRRVPDVAVVMFSAVDDAEMVSAALARGAAGYVLKRISPLDLPAALRQTVEPTVFHPPVATPPREDGLSAKERDVLEQLSLGRSNREIAAALWISDQTVKFHLRNIFRKLGVSTRTEAIRTAHERALVGPIAA